MKKYFKNKFFYIITVLTLLCTIVPTVYYQMGITFPLRDTLNTLLVPMQKLFLAAADAVDGFTGYFYKFDALVEENAALKEEVASLQAQIYDNREIEEMYAWVSDFLEMKTEHMDYTFTAAAVTGRENGNYASILTLDVGEGAGITVGMPVVCPQGLVGRITEVGKGWSRVTTIVEAQSAVGAYVERSHASGIVEGDFTRSGDGICIMNYLPADADIAVGDRILSSGYGDIYPRGLVVGYVRSVQENAYTRALTAEIECAAPISALDNVMIVTSFTQYAQ